VGCGTHQSFRLSSLDLRLSTPNQPSAIRNPQSPPLPRVRLRAETCWKRLDHCAGETPQCTCFGRLAVLSTKVLGMSGRRSFRWQGKRLPFVRNERQRRNSNGPRTRPPCAERNVDAADFETHLGHENRRPLTTAVTGPPPSDFPFKTERIGGSGACVCYREV
jgi:hypothetical protein